MLRGVRRAYGFWGLCEKFACKTLLKAGFGLSGSPRGFAQREGGGWRVEGGVGGGGKWSWKAKRRRRGEQSTESRHAVTVVRCYSAQALSRWSKKHNSWLPSLSLPPLPLTLFLSPLFPSILTALPPCLLAFGLSALWFERWLLTYSLH